MRRVFHPNGKDPRVENSSSEEKYIKPSYLTDVRHSAQLRSIKEKISEVESHGKRVSFNLKLLDARRYELLKQVELLCEEIGSRQTTDSEICDCTKEAESRESYALDRCRGGVDRPEPERCLEECDSSYAVCMLQTSGDSSCACCEILPEEACSDTMIPVQVEKARNLGRLQENLEQAKNRNHCLKKLLRQCGCSMRTLDAAYLRNRFFNEGNKENKVDLMVTIKILQSKCRTKDMIILTLVNELKNNANLQQTSRILKNLANADLSEAADDFDRTAVWRYLVTVPPAATPTCKRVLTSECKRNICIVLLVLSFVFCASLLYLYKYTSLKICSCNTLSSLSSGMRINL